MGNIEDFSKEAAGYLELLNELGIKDKDLSLHKNRIHRRFTFDSPEKTILLQIGDDMCSLFDVSIGGLSFYSMKEYKSGTEFTVDFDDRYSVNVAIVNSFLDREASDDEISFFRHGARFVKEGDGYKCTNAILTYFLEIKKAMF